MSTLAKIIRYVLVATVAFLLLGLLWWYFFLRSQSQTITASDAARGYETSVAPFQSTIGSTYNNVVSGISSFFSNTGGGEGSGKTPPQLWRVTKTPIAGMGFVGNGDSLRIRFVERSSGQILEADPRTGNVTRLTNKLFPKTYEAVFGRVNDVILRSLDEIGAVTSFSGTIATSSPSSQSDNAPATSPTELAGKYLDRNIRAILPILSTRELLYAIENTQGGVDVMRASWDGSKKNIVFSSPLSNWKILVLSDGRIFLIQNPADDAVGFAYELGNGVLLPRIRGIPGLTFLPRASSSAFLFGESQNGTLALSVKTRDDAATIALPLKTVADKCIWAAPLISGASAKKTSDSGPLIAYCAVPQSIPSTQFLNDWYRGIVHTTDAWWRIDANAGTVELVSVDGAGETFDVESPIIDTEGKHIAFMNSEDRTLWLMRINTSANAAPNTEQ